MHSLNFLVPYYVLLLLQLLYPRQTRVDSSTAITTSPTTSAIAIAPAKLKNDPCLTFYSRTLLPHF